MPDPYNLDLTATQINTALNNSWDVDNPPSSGSGKLVNSQNIHQFVTGLVGDETTARENADTALSGRVDTLEAVPSFGVGQIAFVHRVGDTLSGLRTSTGVFDFMDNGYATIVKESSLGATTESGSVFTIPAGTWYLEYGFKVTGVSPSGTINIRVNSSNVVTGSGNTPTLIGSLITTQGSSWTLDIHWTRTGGSARVEALFAVGDRIFFLKKLS